MSNKFQYDPVTNNHNNYCIYSSWVIVRGRAGKEWHFSGAHCTGRCAKSFATWFHFISCLIILWGRCHICFTHGIKYSEPLSCLPGNYLKMTPGRLWLTTHSHLTSKFVFFLLHHFVCNIYSKIQNMVRKYVISYFLCVDQVLPPSTKFME